LIRRAAEQGRSLVAANKCDLLDAVTTQAAVAVSAITGEGIVELRRSIVETLAPRGQIEQDGGFITSLRHEQLLKESHEALEQAQRAATLGIPHEMLLLDLYAALRTHRFHHRCEPPPTISESNLSTFCIGK
jgi:tRNA modification GTPase